jgi:hypothetical protein
MTESIKATTVDTTAPADIDAKYADIVGESGVKGKGKEGVVTEDVVTHKKGLKGDITAPRRDPDDALPKETATGEVVHTATSHKEGFFDKIASAFSGGKTTTVEAPKLEKGSIATEEGLKTARVINERDIDTHQTREKVIEEADIVAPVAHRRVVEQRQGREHLRVIEEVTKLNIKVIAEADRRKIMDSKEDRKPLQRRLIREDHVRAPCEKRQIIEEVWASESVVVFEEKAPIREGTVGRATREEIKSELSGAAVSGGKVTYQGAPASSKVVAEYVVDGVVEIKRQFEEIQVIEIRRIVEERELLSKPLLDETLINKHHSKFMKK